MLNLINPQITTHFVSLAETKLNQRLDNVNLSNFAMSGNDLAYYIGVGDYVISEYDPVIMLIQLSMQDFESDDGSDTSRKYYFQRQHPKTLELIVKPD